MSETYCYSYTALDTYANCPYNFYLKYIAKKRVEEKTLALDFGNLLHKVRELCSQSLMAGEPVDYELLKRVLTEGWRGANKSFPDREEVIPGLDKIEADYFEDWYGREDGIPSYKQRVDNFLAHLKDEENNPDWKPIGAEITFEVPYEDVVLFGTIDKVEQSTHDPTQIRIIDYKSSKKVYDEDKLKTPLQMFTYYLAAKKLFPDKEVVEFTYDFIALGEQRTVTSLLWLQRAKRKLDKILASIAESRETGVWPPKPTPLCYWCNYCRNTPNAKTDYRNLCNYFSLWTPQGKSWKNYRPWEPGTKAEAEEKKVFFL